jgi:hypothetical protein
VQRPDRGDEDPGKRWDRNYSELLQELRVAQTGVQILFAFLLTIPFSTHFKDVTSSLDRFVYVFTVVTTAVAMALLVAPVAHHRLVFRQGRKPELVLTSSRMAFAGLSVLLLSVMGAIYLVLDVVAGAGWAAWLVGALAAIYFFLWYVVPRFKIK